MERKFETGECFEGSERSAWYSLTHYVMGIPIRIEGVGCDGKLYDVDLLGKVVTVSQDPTTTPDHTGNCGAGPWYAQIRSTSSKIPVWIGGKGCNGTFYEVSVTIPVTGAGLQ